MGHRRLPTSKAVVELGSAGQRPGTIKAEGNFAVEFKSCLAEAGALIEPNGRDVGRFDAEHDPRAAGVGKDLADQQGERLGSKTHCLEPMVNHEAINPLVAIIAIERRHGKTDSVVAISDQYWTAGGISGGLGKGGFVCRYEVLLLGKWGQRDGGRRILRRDRFKVYREGCLHRVLAGLSCQTNIGRR